MKGPGNVRKLVHEVKVRDLWPLSDENGAYKQDGMQCPYAKILCESFCDVTVFTVRIQISLVTT